MRVPPGVFVRWIDSHVPDREKTWTPKSDADSEIAEVFGKPDELCETWGHLYRENDQWLIVMQSITPSEVMHEIHIPKVSIVDRVDFPDRDKPSKRKASS